MEAALANMPWSEMKSILSDIEVLLEANEEADVLKNVKQLRADLQTLLTGRENDARRLITEFTARVQRAEAAASEALPSLDDMRARVAVLDRRKAALSEELARLRHARELSVQQLASLTQHMTALKQATANLTASHTAQVPRVKHSLSLYANISSIRWDYESDDFAGYVAPPGGAPVRPFCVLAGTPPVEAADRLWGYVGQATGV